MNCSNCGTRMSCGCQRRTASDGKSCCSKCINTYEAKLKLLKTPKTSTDPIITDIIYTRK